jgi:hypothetical protein
VLVAAVAAGALLSLAALAFTYEPVIGRVSPRGGMPTTLRCSR